MFTKCYTVFIGIIFFLILFLEGSSVQHGRDISYILILCLPILLFYLSYLRKKEIKYPKLFLSILIVLIAYEIINLFFSVNLEYSFTGFTVLISYFFISIYTNLNRDLFEKYFLKYLIYAIYLFVAIFTIVNVIYTNKLPMVDYMNNYQFIYTPNGLHYHIGDLLLIPLITNLYWLIQKKEKKYLLGLLISLPFFILSFSRSAYLAFLAMGLLLLMNFKDKWSKYRKEKTFEIVTLIIIPLAIIPFFVFGVSLRFGDMVNDVNLFSKSKTIVGNRQEYFKAGIEAIKQNPLFGIGLRNFVYGYEKYRAPFDKEVTSSSHNVLIDILVGNGIFGFIIFVILLHLFYKKSNKNIYFYLFLTLLINFQTDYVFLMYSFLLIFFVLAGISYEEDKYVVNKFTCLIPASLSIIAVIIVISNIFSIMGKFEISHALFPLNNENNESLINQYLSDKNYIKALNLMEFNYKIHSSDLNALYFNLNIYNMFNNVKMEVKYNEYICNASSIFDCYNNLYAISLIDKNEIYKESFKKMLGDYFQSWDNFYTTMKKNNQQETYSIERGRASDFCLTIYAGYCPFTFGVGNNLK